MELQTQEIETLNQTDAEILAELKRLSAIITKRRRNNKSKETIDNSEVKKRGRPIAAWRHGEDGKYDSHAIDPEYSTLYWREKYRKPYTCPICDTLLKTAGSNILKHQRTLHCQLAKFRNEPQND
jgi:hypothetical protein